MNVNTPIIKRPQSSKKVHREPQRKTAQINPNIVKKNKQHLEKAKKYFSFIRGLILGVGSTMVITSEVDIALTISITINLLIATCLVDYTTLKNKYDFDLKDVVYK